jgi:hypothetical protein
MKTTKQQDEKIKDLFDNTNFLIDLDYEYLIYNLEDLKDLEEDFYQMISEHELIYYSKCMTFLKDYDNSLRESLIIAEELGYTLKNLSSEILATLLIQRYMSDEVSEIIEELKEILEEEETEEN